jgi:hypothetical protein
MISALHKAAVVVGVIALNIWMLKMLLSVSSIGGFIVFLIACAMLAPIVNELIDSAFNPRRNT